MGALLRWRRAGMLLPCLAAWLGGCATPAGYEKALARWTGSAEVDLVRQWGAPANSYAVGDRRFLVYESRQEIVMPEILPTYETRTKGGKTITTPVGGSPGWTSVYTCTTTFELQGARVVGSSFKGNDCRAKE